MKKFQLLKWTAEIKEKELQFLFLNESGVDLLDDSNPTVIFETESESEAHNSLEKESELLCVHIFNHGGLKFANVDCLMLQEVEVDEDGDVVECEYLDIRYPKGEWKMKKLTVILFILLVTFLTTQPVDEPTVYKPAPRLITKNETHEFYEEPQTHNIIKVNKRTGEAVDLRKTREQLFK